jgi:hypothetical protein
MERHLIQEHLSFKPQIKPLVMLNHGELFILKIFLVLRLKGL